MKNKSPRGPKAHLIRGSLFMLGAVFMFGVGNALVKIACTTMPIMEVVFFRCFLATLLLSAFFSFFNRQHFYRSSDLKKQLVRGGVGFISMSALFLSFALLPMTDATAISFATPLFISALSVPMLREKISPLQWATIVIGFIGVAIMSSPTGNVTILGVGAALVAACVEGIVMIMSRQLSRVDKPFTSVFYHGLVISFVTLLILPFVWQAISVNDFLLLLALAIVSCLGQILVVYAYSTAPAAIVAPLLYTLILWGGLAGYFYWGEKITTTLLIGTPLVILSGLFVIYLESKKTPQALPEENVL